MARIEWQTVGLLGLCYLSWLALTVGHAAVPLVVLLSALALVIGFHTSLQHEIIHGHPTRSPLANTLLALPALNLFTPYLRYYDTHIKHHEVEHLTNPHEDPESYYLTAGQWQQTPPWLRTLHRANYTLLGRIVLGPALILPMSWYEDGKALLAGKQRVQQAWLLHALMVGLVLAWLHGCGFPVWLYLLANYVAYGVMLVRSFIEHRAVPVPAERSIIVESRGLLSFLFLNNNLHALHHLQPSLPWYQLRTVYAQQREHILQVNGGYWFRSYAEIARRYALYPKSDVQHPWL